MAHMFFLFLPLFVKCFFFLLKKQKCIFITLDRIDRNST